MIFQRRHYKLLAFPLAVAILIAAYFLIWRLLGLPEYRDLVGIIQKALQEHGLWVVLLASVVEGVLLVGNYVPGGLVVFLAIISAGNSFGKLSAIVALIILGFMVANVVNYMLGKYGWHRLLVKFGLGHQLEQAQNKWRSKSFKVIFLSYWQANLAALTATAAGVLKVPFRSFLVQATVSVVFWHIIWAIIVYYFREQAVNAITNVYIIFGVVLAWAVFVAIQSYRKSRKTGVNA